MSRAQQGPGKAHVERIVIVPSKWAWAHFEIEVAADAEGRWWICGAWHLSHIGYGSTWSSVYTYPSRSAALLNYVLILRDQMLGSARRRDQALDLRQARAIAGRVTEWLLAHCNPTPVPRPVQLTLAL